jgi:hypothetical protein
MLEIGNFTLNSYDAVFIFHYLSQLFGMESSTGILYGDAVQQGIL